jgi:hypothetical protein
VPVDMFIRSIPLPLEKIRGKKDLNLELKGKLASIFDIVTGKELKQEIQSSSFVFNSSLPTKDGKDFRANQFELSSNVKSLLGGSFNISNKTTNSTKCTLVKDGKFVKDLAGNTAIKYAGQYNAPEVDNSARGQRKDVDDGHGTPIPQNRPKTVGQ